MMTAPPILYEQIKSWEGCASTTSETCKGDVATLGYGHTSSVKDGEKLKPRQAEIWLHEDVAYACKVVNDQVKVALTQNQFDALVDFVFNLGETAFVGSTLLKKLNAGDYIGAAEEFPKWDHFKG